jgi:hexokinase
MKSSAEQAKLLRALEDTFSLSVPEIRIIMKHFHREMKKGLSGRRGSLQMIPTHAERPRGNERGMFLALDLGGTNFRVVGVGLTGKRKTRPPLVRRFVLTKDHITGESDALFDFIAECIHAFMRRHHISTVKRHDIGFTFSFPVAMRTIASGVLARWTKGFRVRGVIGRDVVKLLNESLVKNGLYNTRVVALANDTVSTFVAKSYEDQNCDVGVIIGTGTNACYCEKLSGIPKWRGAETATGEMLINIEWGNFNRLKRTRYDIELDRTSRNPGEQILEKMVSGMYLGEIARLVVRDLIGKKLLFAGRYRHAFGRVNALKTEYLSIIENDRSGNLARTGKLLGTFGVKHASVSDRRLLKELCGMLSTRAARVSAAAMASVVTRIDPGLARKHTIAVDGSVYEKYPGFSRRVRATLREIFGRKASRITLSLVKDGSGRGAAIIAASVAARGAEAHERHRARFAR